jgi:hypothetical protein
MDWSKLYNDEVLYNEYAPRDYIAILKFRALFYEFEREPKDSELKHFLTSKQIEFVRKTCGKDTENILNMLKENKQKRENDKKRKASRQQKIDNFQSESETTPDGFPIIEREVLLDKSNNNYIPKHFDVFLNELIHVHNQVFENVYPFGNVSKITDKRKAKIFEIQKTNLKTITDWEDYFKHIKNYTHVPRLDWGCLDTIISEGYMAQILEGKYDRYRRQANGLYYRYNEHGEKDGNTKYKLENGEFIRE